MANFHVVNKLNNILLYGIYVIEIAKLANNNFLVSAKFNWLTYGQKVVISIVRNRNNLFSVHSFYLQKWKSI